MLKTSTGLSLASLSSPPMARKSTKQGASHSATSMAPLLGCDDQLVELSQLHS